MIVKAHHSNDGSTFFRTEGCGCCSTEYADLVNPEEVWKYGERMTIEILEEEIAEMEEMVEFLKDHLEEMKRRA